jgi:hypothetical protein
VSEWVVAGFLVLAACSDAPQSGKAVSGSDAGDQDAAATRPTLDGGHLEPTRDADGSAPMQDSDSGQAGLDAGGARPMQDASTDAAPDDAGHAQPGLDDALLFVPNELLEVSLTLADADWAQIRGEGRTLNEVFTYCLNPAFAYTVVPASIQLRDAQASMVGLRKKGFIGSLSVQKPSFHLDLAQYVAGQQLFGTKTLVLNNSRQDASYTRQCMAYAVFAAAGVPAPRCSFAHVSVNGTSLGVYVNVEPVKKPFLARHFGNDTGNLYEGSGLTDFRADMLANFEKKTNVAQPLSDQLTLLTTLLARADDNILDELEVLVDMDAFMRFWAVETLIAHWDGYTGDLNNFFVYVHPDTHKLLFIPWGTDGAFDRVHPYLPEQGRPQSVYAWARLPRRLYAIEQTRERFRSTLRMLLNEHWDETALLAEVDRIATLLGGAAGSAALEQQRQFIRNRRAELVQELDGAAPAWPFDERPEATCHAERNTPIRGSFRATWGDLNAFAAAAENRIDVVLDGTHHVLSNGLASAGPDASGHLKVQVVATLPDGRVVGVQFTLNVLPLATGDVALHGFETYGVVVRAMSTSSSQYTFDGFVGEGKLSFDRVAAASGEPLSGQFEAKLVTVEPGLAAQFGKP